MFHTSLRLTLPFAALLAGCASAPADTTVASAQPAPVAKCRNSEAPTGTSIVRKDCSSTNNVSTVDPHDLMDSKRTALPNR